MSSISLSSKSNLFLKILNIKGFGVVLMDISFVATHKRVIRFIKVLLGSIIDKEELF